MKHFLRLFLTLHAFHEWQIKEDIDDKLRTVITNVI